MLGALLVEDVFALLLVFARLGGAFMLLPGVSSQFYSARARLLMAVAVTVVVTPLVSPALPSMPAEVGNLFLMLVTELLIGIFIGTLGALVMAVLEITGMMISFQSGLANATLFNPLLASQTSLIGTFLFVTGALLIFITNLHHLMLIALVDSYAAFAPAVLPPVGDLAETVARRMAESFSLAFQLAAPFFVIGLLFNTVLGVLARLMPQLMVFFIGVPMSILMMLVAMSIALPVMMGLFLDDLSGTFQRFLEPAGG